MIEISLKTGVVKNRVGEHLKVKTPLLLLAIHIL